MGVGGQGHGYAVLPPGKTRYPLYRRLGGPQGRSGRVRKIPPPPGFDPRTVQPVLIPTTLSRSQNRITAPKYLIYLGWLAVLSFTLNLFSVNYYGQKTLWVFIFLVRVSRHIAPSGDPYNFQLTSFRWWRFKISAESEMILFSSSFLVQSNRGMES